MNNLKNLQKIIKPKNHKSGLLKIDKFFHNKYMEAEKLLTERANNRKTQYDIEK